MQYAMNISEITNEIKKMGVIEKLCIITDIWDEIKESEALETISEKEQNILLNRLKRYRANPYSAVDWTELKKEINDKYNK